MKKWTVTLILSVAVILWHLPAYAQIDFFNQDIIIEQNNDMIKIRRDLDLRRRQTSEITRGNELARSVKDLIRSAKDALTAFKWRQSDQMRGLELNRITNDNAQDTLRRNKGNEQIQRRLQRDRMQALKDRNRDLKQRIRDLSRR